MEVALIKRYKPLKNKIKSQKTYLFLKATESLVWKFFNKLTEIEFNFFLSKIRSIGVL